MRWAALGLLLLGLPKAALADERFDHRGAVGLLVGGGATGFTLGATTASATGIRPLGELGGTYAIGVNGNELTLAVRGSVPGAQQAPLLGLAGGYRGYFGYQQVKTFLELQITTYVTPTFLIGPRVGGGIQYELSPLVGIYLGGGVNLAFGRGLLLSGEVLGGIQVRSYLLE